MRRVQSLVLRGGALELAKDGFFVIEEVADQAVCVAFVHGERVFDAGTQDAGGQSLRQGGDEGLVGGGELD